MFTTPFTFMKAATSAASLPSGYSFYVDASDSASYPGTGTTWYDLSGNGYDMTLNSASVFVNNGGNDKYMDFASGIAKYLPGGSLANIPTTTGEEGTWVIYTSPKTDQPLGGFDPYMTLLRIASGVVHPVIITEDGVSLNVYNGGFIDSGFDMSTIPNVVTQPHMMAWKFKQSTTPNWEFFYDSYTSSAQATVNTSVSSWGNSVLGAWHNDSSDPTAFSQNWGKVWFAVYYPFLLSTAELNQVNDYIAARY